MKETMGQTIKRLRKERNLTQEELAGRLNLSAQSISKWENGTSMPDIAQIVPLASVFAVSTDTLFGIAETTPDQEAGELLRQAEALKVYGQRQSYLAAYDLLAEGLKRYPGNLLLMNSCMHLGTSMAMPDSGWLYAPDRADELAAEAVRQADFIITYSKSISDVMRARQILVYLHSARGEYALAAETAREFPVRTDFTLYSHMALINEYKGNYSRAAACLCTDIDYSLQALEDHSARLGLIYYRSGQIDDAIRVYETFFVVMEAIFRENCPPPYHDFDSGDCRILLAQAYLAAGREEDAMTSLEKAVHYWLDLLTAHPGDSIPLNALHTSPLIRESELQLSIPRHIIRTKLHEKLAAEEIRPLNNHPRFAALRELVENLP